MSTLTEQFKRSLVIAKKNIKIYYSKGPVIIFGLVFRFSWLWPTLLDGTYRLERFYPD